MTAFRRDRRTYLVLCMITAIGLVGCRGFGLQGFESDDSSGARKGTTALYYSAARPTKSTGSSLGSLLEGHPGMSFDPTAKAAIAAQCQQGGTEVAPLLLALLPSIGKLALDLYLDGELRALEDLKRASEATYSARIPLPRALLQPDNCLILVRLVEGEKLPAAVVIVKLLDAAAASSGSSFARPDALAYKPVYIRVRKAAAVTKAAETPRITVSLALTLKAIAKHPQADVPVLASLGESAVTIPDLDIGELGKSRCGDGGCPLSEPIPLPTNSGTLVLSLAVAEKGHIGINFDVSSNELKAIREAIGPALKDGLKGLLE